jgi:hypothetical protein
MSFIPLALGISVGANASSPMSDTGDTDIFCLAFTLVFHTKVAPHPVLTSRHPTPPATTEYVSNLSMASLYGPYLSLFGFAVLFCVALGHAVQAPLQLKTSGNNDTITRELFFELEELARIVDVAYCVGTAGLGIQKPFKCLSHCGDEDFKHFELVTVRLPHTFSSITCGI